ncbi:OLC1v1017195C1 [Oldenlandia corymbosa var. corymbosa]|uniref:OLC1v1017195C1 n=1 Tax=Oldenlandia corymbosa var. corymbosa TaxID=529605 RepID=A0AAV1E8Z0_OLDCO|nr:OLC1v1017195C1 [Oldenlandia corymbosa var. corymbosa]
MEKGKTLHVVMFPWLAMGHFIPFLELSKHLARKGHKVSFISSPRNIQKLPKFSQDLAPLIELVSIPLQRIENLPEEAESSMDIPRDKQRYLKMAFDLLQSPVATFLEGTKPKPDWIIVDYASYWLPQIAAKIGISTAFFSLFTAATLAFFGPPSFVLNGEDDRTTAESFTIVPKWIPFQSNVTFRLHEMIKSFEDSFSQESVVSDPIRFATSIQESDLVVVRTSVEFEPEWVDLVRELYKKPVVSLGVLPPSLEDKDESGTDEKWLEIKGWLDNQSGSRVVYVALGTEATLSEEEVQKMALGLEQSELPFFWVLRKPPTSVKDVLEMLPEGFMGRIAANSRGMVCTEWVPQVKILSHPAVGAFLTHCGWNSVIEALGFGRVLVLFPLINEQGLNARLLQEKQVGVEIPREAEDGFFTSAAVADTLRLAVLSEEGESIRVKASEMKSLFGDSDLNQSYMDSFIRHLGEARIQKTSNRLSK